MLFVCNLKLLHKHCLQFLLGLQRTYAIFWGDKQRALWYVMAFSVVVNTQCFSRFCRLWQNLENATFFSGEGRFSPNPAQFVPSI